MSALVTLDSLVLAITKQTDGQTVEHTCVCISCLLMTAEVAANGHNIMFYTYLTTATTTNICVCRNRCKTQQLGKVLMKCCCCVCCAANSCFFLSVCAVVGGRLAWTYLQCINSYSHVSTYIHVCTYVHVVCCMSSSTIFLSWLLPLFFLRMCQRRRLDWQWRPTKCEATQC